MLKAVSVCHIGKGFNTQYFGCFGTIACHQLQAESVNSCS